jgi:hypothetical protein
MCLEKQKEKEGLVSLQNDLIMALTQSQLEINQHQVQSSPFSYCAALLMLTSFVIISTQAGKPTTLESMHK